MNPEKKPARQFFTPKRMALVLFLIAAPALGYALMHASLHLFPMETQNSAVHFTVTALVVAVGLLVPYWLLKGFLHEARSYDPTEREFDLQDIPKDKQQLDRDMDSARS